MQLECLQHGAVGGGCKDCEVRVEDCHAAELESVKVVAIVSTKLPQPWLRVAAPIALHQVVLRSARLALEPKLLQALEASRERGGAGGVDVGDGDLLARHAVHAMPLHAHQRHRRPVPWRFHVLQHTR